MYTAWNSSISRNWTLVQEQHGVGVQQLGTWIKLMWPMVHTVLFKFEIMQYHKRPLFSLLFHITNAYEKIWVSSKTKKLICIIVTAGLCILKLRTHTLWGFVRKVKRRHLVCYLHKSNVVWFVCHHSYLVKDFHIFSLGLWNKIPKYV